MRSYSLAFIWLPGNRLACSDLKTSNMGFLWPCTDRGEKERKRERERERECSGCQSHQRKTRTERIFGENFIFSLLRGQLVSRRRSLKGKKYTSLERDHIYWEGRFFIWYLSMRVYKHKAGKNQTLDHQSLYKFVWTKQSIHSLALNQPHQLQTDRLDSTVDLTTSNINFKIFWCGDYAKSKTTEGYFGSVPFFPSQPPIDHGLFS